MLGRRLAQALAPWSRPVVAHLARARAPPGRCPQAPPVHCSQALLWRRLRVFRPEIKTGRHGWPSLMSAPALTTPLSTDPASAPASGLAWALASAWARPAGLGGGPRRRGFVPARASCLARALLDAGLGVGPGVGLRVSAGVGCVAGAPLRGASRRRPEVGGQY